MVPDGTRKIYAGYRFDERKRYIAAIFGAMFGQFTLKYPILAVAGLGIPVGLFMGGPALGIPFLAQTWFVIVCSVFGTILIGRVLYKQHIIG